MLAARPKVPSEWSFDTFISTGTFVDPDADLTVFRDASSTLTFGGSVNWEWVSITYGTGAGEVTGQLFKTSVPSAVGNLRRSRTGGSAPASALLSRSVRM